MRVCDVRKRFARKGLADASRWALIGGVRAARAGVPINEIGRAVETMVASYG